MLQNIDNTDLDNFNVSIVNIRSLKGHEMTDANRLRLLTNQIESDGVLQRPIVADKQTNVILDGHHRTAALQLLGCSRIPVCYVDYSDECIGMKCTAKNLQIQKSDVIKAATKGTPFPPKSTWHYLVLQGVIEHISCIQKRVDVPLEKLK